MFHVKTMTPRISSKQTTAAASKIKNKLLNTSSSFFKVSLKNNNKALALALEAEKKRRRQLEMEVVFFQKQVETLCFELATMKYKHRKLLLILKNLHCNTLQHLGMVSDLFPDSDLLKPSEEANTASGDINKENLVFRRSTDQLPPQPEIPEAFLFPHGKVLEALPEKDNRANVLDIQSGLQLAPDVFSDKRSSEGRRSSQHRPAPQTQTSSTSSSLREDVERFSMTFSKSGLDMKSKLCPQNSLTPSSGSVHENRKHPLSDNVPLPSGSVLEPETGSKQEKTLLLDTAMDITLSNPVEIVTVETITKKPGPSDKPKAKKKKEQASGFRVENPQPQSSADSPGEVQDAPTGAMLQTEDPAEDTAPEPHKTQSKSATSSRIPKPMKSGSCQKKTKKKPRSINTAKSTTESCDPQSPPDLDDYFKDPNFKLSEVRESLRLPPEVETAEESRPRITCRRSRTKSRRMSTFPRNTFFILPPSGSEVRHSESEQTHNAVEEVLQDTYGAFTEPGLSGLSELLFCAEDVTPPHSERVANTEQRKEAETVSAGSRKPKCRATFIVSVDRESPTWSRASPPAGSFIHQVEEAHVMQDSESSPLRQSDGDQAQKTPSSGKRPWLATQDSENPKQDSISNNNQEAVHAEQGSTLESEFQKAKKARREETNPSSKKKKVQRGECGESLKKKKKQKIKSSSKELRPEDDVCRPSDENDGSSFKGVDPERNENLKDDEQITESNSDLRDDITEYLFALKPEKSTFKMGSYLHTVTKQNLRKTFVVQRRKTKDRVSSLSFMTSDVSDSFGHMVDRSEAAVHQTLGDLLTDEVPPWLAADVSTADTELGSLPATPRRETLSRTAGIEEFAAVSAEASPAGRVLTTVTNTISTPDAGAGGRSRRQHGVVSYKEPSLNRKMRRGDALADRTFLNSSVFQDGKKKKKQKKTGTNTNTNQQPVTVD